MNEQQAQQNNIQKNSVQTQGGTYVTDSVEAHRDFIGRDQITHIHQDSKPAPGTAPYRGLRFFGVEDAHSFFGREALTAELVETLRHQRFLAVVGASGSGKSSLLRAGIASAIQRGQMLADGVMPPLGSQRWPIHIITPTAHPLEALVRSLINVQDVNQDLERATTLLESLHTDPYALHHYITTAENQQAGRRSLLIVDQFEEIFTLCQDRAERQAFVGNLLNAAIEMPVNEGTATVIIALRADFYARCAEFPNLRSALEQYQRYIGPMTVTELQRAIEEPASRGGWDLEAGLVDLLLDDVEDEPGALPLLSHALLETWKRRSGRMLTIAGYLESGRVSGAIAHTAESVYQQLEPDQRIIAQNVFLRLTAVGDSAQYTRRRARMDEIIPTSDDSLDVGQVLRRLVAARLAITSRDEALTPGQHRQSYVEVAHEALLREWPTLQNWLADNRERLRVQHRLSEDCREWEQMAQDNGLLYRGMRLQQAVEWLVDRPTQLPTQLSQLEQDFLDASRAEAEKAALLDETMRQRELEQQRALTRAAEAQQQAELARAQEAEDRVLEQAQTSQYLRRRAWILAALAFLALLFAGIAIYYADDAIKKQTALEQERDLLNTAKTKLQQSYLDLDKEFDRAERQRKEANEQKQIAEAGQRELRSEMLAAQALRILEQEDPTGNEALIAAHNAVTTTLDIDGTVRANADAALRAAVNRSFWQATLSEAGNIVAFSPDGKSLVASSPQTHLIQIWDVETRQIRQTLSDLPSPVHAAAYHPDEPQLAVAGENGVQVWDSEQNQMLVQHYTATVTFLVYNPKGTALAAIDDDGLIHVWNSEDGMPLPMPRQKFMDRANAVAYSQPSGLLMAAGNSDRNVYLWTTENGRLHRTFSGHAAAVRAVAFSPSSTTLASGSNDKTIRLWDIQSGDLLRTLRGHTGPVRSLLYIDDGKRLVSASNDKSVRIWDVGTGQQLYALQGHNSGVMALSYDRGRGTIASATAKSVRLWDARPMEEKRRLWGHTSGVRAVAHHPVLPQFVSADVDGTLLIRNSETGRQLRKLTGHTGSIWSVVYSPDGETILSGSGDQTAQVWDARTGQLRETLGEHGAAVWSAVYSPDNQQIATANAAGTIYVWDALTATKVITRTDHQDDVYALSYNPDGRYMASASGDKTIRVWETDSWTTHQLLETDNAIVRAIAYSPDGRHLVSAGSDKRISFWDMATGEIVRTLAAHTGLIRSIQYSRDGRYLVSSSTDRSVRVWDAQTGDDPIRILQEHWGSVNAVIYDPQDQHIISASSDGTVHIAVATIDMLLAQARARIQRGNLESQPDSRSMELIDTLSLR